MSEEPIYPAEGGMTVEECMAYTEKRRHHWWLVGVEIATKSPIYQCSACNGQRFKLLSLKATLPDTCPKCKAPQGSSLDDDDIPPHLRRDDLHYGPGT